jgi:hypothetical protein
MRRVEVSTPLVNGKVADEPLPRQQPAIDLADCLQDHRILEIAQRGIASP